MIMATLITSALMLAPIPADGGPDVAESTYKGKHYSQAWESWRKCVVWRESRDNPRAISRTGKYHGLYQFGERDWRRSLTFMVMPEHRDRRAEVKALRNKPISQWSRYWQDAAFWAALRNGAGAKHWAAQFGACNGLRP